MADEADPAARYMAEVERICDAEPALAPLAGGVLAALKLGIAADSRSFARIFGIEHALVLREVQHLAEVEQLTITKRDERTQRCSYAVASEYC